ncbi:MAG: glucosidase, partial [Gammaproteobacteria bacterium]|nr:glucosidase [Gammaproteobacteria bacterium]
MADAERERMAAQSRGDAGWRRWGPYLAERAWGTVREDYSYDGEAWDYFDHEQSRSRAYRWNEDGMGGISDEQQRLCFALAMWNGRDPILKERAFGLTGPQGNHGEDVKEYFFYQDATPSHSYLRYLYKYPQAEYPYRRLIDENAKLTRHEPSFDLLDSGVFAESRYWDITVVYAKDGPDKIHVTIHAKNQGPDEAEVHLLPQLWFRNTWSWDEPAPPVPAITTADAPEGASWAVRAAHETLGTYVLCGETPGELLFTDNETDQRVLGGENDAPYVKNAFHRRVVDGDESAVNPALTGTKFAAWYSKTVAPGQAYALNLVLSAGELDHPFDRHGAITAARRSEADVFYDDLLPMASPEDHRIMRQALAGMIWSKQFYHYDVARWLEGDEVKPPVERRHGRNSQWRHLRAHHVITMPDAWEYPWFAAWDQAYQCAALALIDVDLAKAQMELLLSENFLHPNGQIPAYEWDFGDTNPPVHAVFALRVYQRESLQRGQGDHNYL